MAELLSPDAMDPNEIVRQRLLARTTARNADIGERMKRFMMEVVNDITPETSDEDVYAALWAVTRFLYDYANTPDSEDIDPSTVREIGGMALSIFENVTGLVTEDTTLSDIDRMGGVGEELAGRYMNGFPTSTRLAGTDQASEQ